MLKHKLLLDDKQPRLMAWRQSGRGVAGKTLSFVAAVALNKEKHPIKMRMTVVDGFKTKSIADWAKQHVASGSTVISDGMAYFRAVKEANCEHLGVVTGGSWICWSTRRSTG